MFCVGTIFAQSPTEILSDDFENGAASWTLDGTAMSDRWVVDTNYQGLIMDMGIIQIPVFPNSPDQPSTFIGSPRSKYLHIQDGMVCSLLSYCNATYGAAGTLYATITQPLDFTDYENATVSYSYFVEGHVDSAYAHLEYSLDSINWIEVGNKMVNQSDWKSTTVSIPALDGVAQAYFRIKWRNLGYSDTNLGIGIDELKIEAVNVNATYVKNISIDQPTYCSEIATPITVTFTASGTFDPGNVFTSYISDASGDFSNQQAIGNVTSTTNGTVTINGNLPALPVGNYQIKVVASSPVVEDTLASSFSIIASPQVTVSPNQTINAGESITLTASGADTYTWTPSAELNMATGNTVIATPSATTTYNVTGKATNGCTSSSSVTITVSSVGLTSMDLDKIAVYPNPSTGDFSIQLVDNKEINNIEIWTVDGKKVNHFKFQNNTLSINQSGVYIVKIMVGNQLHIIHVIKQ